MKKESPQDKPFKLPKKTQSQLIRRAERELGRRLDALQKNHLIKYSQLFLSKRGFNRSIFKQDLQDLKQGMQTLIVFRE